MADSAANAPASLDLNSVGGDSGAPILSPSKGVDALRMTIAFERHGPSGFGLQLQVNPVTPFVLERRAFVDSAFYFVRFGRSACKKAIKLVPAFSPKYWVPSLRIAGKKTEIEIFLKNFSDSELYFSFSLFLIPLNKFWIWRAVFECFGFNFRNIKKVMMIPFEKFFCPHFHCSRGRSTICLLRQATWVLLKASTTSAVCFVLLLAESQCRGLLRDLLPRRRDCGAGMSFSILMEQT